MRAALISERDARGGWRPVGVLLATRYGIAVKTLPDDPERTAKWKRIARDATRPTKGPYTDERGTWDDWVDYAIGALSNGHTQMLAETKPEPTVRALYNRDLLDLGAGLSNPSSHIPTQEVPTLTGRPSKIGGRP